MQTCARVGFQTSLQPFSSLLQALTCSSSVEISSLSLLSFLSPSYASTTKILSGQGNPTIPTISLEGDFILIDRFGSSYCKAIYPASKKFHTISSNASPLVWTLVSILPLGRTPQTRQRTLCAHLWALAGVAPWRIAAAYIGPSANTCLKDGFPMMKATIYFPLQIRDMQV